MILPSSWLSGRRSGAVLTSGGVIGFERSWVGSKIG
jgi:hypothetical protein